LQKAPGGSCGTPRVRIISLAMSIREEPNDPMSPGFRPGLLVVHYAASVIREGLPVSREPALLTSAGRMPERSQHRVSEGRMPKRTSGDGAWAATNQRGRAGRTRKARLYSRKTRHRVVFSWRPPVAGESMASCHESTRAGGPDTQSEPQAPPSRRRSSIARGERGAAEASGACPARLTGAPVQPLEPA
jgi:hypothetical protein